MSPVLNALGDPLLQAVWFLFGAFTIRRIVVKNRARSGRAARPRVRRLAPAYRGMRWGDAPGLDMELYHDGRVEKLYKRRGETPMLGASPLRSVVYSYHRNRLQAVMLEVPRKSAADVLATAVREWGAPGSIGGAGARRRYWNVGAGASAIQAVFDESPSSPLASLVVTSTWVARERVRDLRPEIRVARPGARVAPALEAAS